MIVLLSIMMSRVALADDFLKSSPGELSLSHADIDNQDQCRTCHEPDNSISARKCLGCHDHQNLKKRIDAGRGFHVSVKVKGRECKLCHQEHRGRGFDLMGWKGVGGSQNFDHKLTGWELKGKHAASDCTKCHKSVNKQGLRTYLDTEATCGGCHRKDQPHGEIRQMFMRCDRCHSETVWKPQKPTLDFNHNSKDQAAMPLLGAHADVACSKCHSKAAFKLPKYNGECVQCHASPHDGQLFGTKKCETCHSPTLRSLRDVRFDHKKEAGYALTGKHGQISCTTCHTKSLGKRKPEPGCESCHQKDSKHGARFEKFPTCTTCHSQRGWKSGFQFNHGANTEFDLTAKHTKATCRSCHRGKTPSDFERFDAKKGCMSCHRHEKAHGGKFQNKECLTCHQEGGSKSMSKGSLETFHGEKSKFPLRNGHAGVQCQLCHINDIYQETSPECGASCHEDSLHRASLGAKCTACHEPGQWPAVRFDHTEDTKWPLKGRHTEIKSCETCHPSRQYSGTPNTCGSAGCHKSDDIHQGKLGSACETCHAETGALLFRHNRDSKFKIDGKHAPLLCAECHKSVTFKPVPDKCFGCHPEPEIHRGRYGLECQQCHSTSSFLDTRALHDVGDFSLTGAHDQLACARCHPKGEKRQGSGNLCITCHRKDDIHANSLSPRCGECHTQRSFSPARFDHTSTGCALMGLHATLPCSDCHRAGNYGAVSPLCISCHRSEALRATQPDHRTLLDCGSCHNPSAWIPATQLGRQTICR